MIFDHLGGYGKKWQNGIIDSRGGSVNLKENVRNNSTYKHHKEYNMALAMGFMKEMAGVLGNVVFVHEGRRF